MSTTKQTRTNVATQHPDLYKTTNAAALLANKTAVAEGLSPRLIELVKIRASQINGCAFCLRMHTKDALAQGESHERLSVLPAWRESDYFDVQERAALALTEYITDISTSHSNRENYDSAVECFTPGQVSAVTWLSLIINVYNRIAIGSSYTVAP